MPRLMEIRKQHGFPQPFGKASQKTLLYHIFHSLDGGLSFHSFQAVALCR